MVTFAEPLAVPAKKLVCLDAGSASPRDLRVGGGLSRLVGLRVALLLPSEAEPQQNPQRVGIERQDGSASREEKNLLRARLADRGKLPECLDGFLGLAAHGGREIAAEVLERDRGDRAEFLGGLLRHDSFAPDLVQCRSGRLEDLFRRQTDAFPQHSKRLIAPFVVGQVGDVLVEDQLEWFGQSGRSRLPVELAQRIEDASKEWRRARSLFSLGNGHRFSHGPRPESLTPCLTPGTAEHTVPFDEHTGPVALATISTEAPMKGFVALALGTVALAVLGQENSAARSGPITLTPGPKTVAWGYYDATTPPIVRVRSGDTVRIQTLITTSPARLEAAGLPASEVEQALRDIHQEVTNKGPGGHILTGPVFVEGAEPGDTLEVRIQSIALALPYAYNAFSPGRGFCPKTFRTLG